jgi:DNA mismatch repair ATPase MutS
VLFFASLAAYILGRKNSKSLRIQAELARDQYKKESEAIEKEYKERDQKLKRAERLYNKALSSLEEKYDDENSDLRREKDAHYKNLLKKSRQDPEQLNSLLKDMGINEV